MTRSTTEETIDNHSDGGVRLNRISAHGKGASLCGMAVAVAVSLLTTLVTEAMMLFMGSLALFVVFWQLGWSPNE